MKTDSIIMKVLEHFKNGTVYHMDVLEIAKFTEEETRIQTIAEMKKEGWLCSNSDGGKDTELENEIRIQTLQEVEELIHNNRDWYDLVDKFESLKKELIK